MIVLVCGGRNFSDKQSLYDALNKTHETYGITAIVHGWASGADSFGQRWAYDNQINAFAVPAKWNKYEKAAGPYRNAEMLKLFNVGAVIAAPGGAGTKNMIEQAERKGITVWRLE